MKLMYQAGRGEGAIDIKEADGVRVSAVGKVSSGRHGVYECNCVRENVWKCDGKKEEMGTFSLLWASFYFSRP